MSSNKCDNVELDAHSGDELERTAASTISPHTGVETHAEESQSVSADEVAVDEVPGANEEKKSEPSGDVVVGVGLGDLGVTDRPAPDSGVASDHSRTNGIKRRGGNAAEEIPEGGTSISDKGAQVLKVNVPKDLKDNAGDDLQESEGSEVVLKEEDDKMGAASGTQVVSGNGENALGSDMMRECRMMFGQIQGMSINLETRIAELQDHAVISRSQLSEVSNELQRMNQRVEESEQRQEERIVELKVEMEEKMKVEMEKIESRLIERMKEGGKSEEGGKEEKQKIQKSKNKEGEKSEKKDGEVKEKKRLPIKVQMEWGEVSLTAPPAEVEQELAYNHGAEIRYCYGGRQRGVAAVRPIMEGTTIACLELRDWVEGVSLRNYSHMGRKDGKPVVMDGEGVCFSKYVNSSCRPNTRSDGYLKGGKMVVMLKTIRDIEPGEWITVDYGWTLEEGVEPTPCLCGEDNCRGVIEHEEESVVGSEVSRDFVELESVGESSHSSASDISRHRSFGGSRSSSFSSSSSSSSSVRATERVTKEGGSAGVKSALKPRQSQSQPRGVSDARHRIGKKGPRTSSRSRTGMRPLLSAWHRSSSMQADQWSPTTNSLLENQRESQLRREKPTVRKAGRPADHAEDEDSSSLVGAMRRLELRPPRKSVLAMALDKPKERPLYSEAVAGVVEGESEWAPVSDRIAPWNANDLPKWGGASKLSAEDHVALFKRVMQARGMHARQAVRTFSLFLQKDALEWHKSFSPSGVTAETTWEERWNLLEAGFLSRFAKEVKVADALTDWMQAKQGAKEDVLAYAQRRAALERKARSVMNVEEDGGVLFSKEQVMKHFMDGLRPGIQTIWGLASPRDVEEMLDMAKRAEGKVKIEPEVQVIPDKGKDERLELMAAQFKEAAELLAAQTERLDAMQGQHEAAMMAAERGSDQSGGSSGGERSPKGGRGASGGRGGGCLRCGQPGHRVNACPKPRSSAYWCFRCGVDGHISTKCQLSMEDLNCQRCQKKGHTTKACERKNGQKGRGAAARRPPSPGVGQKRGRYGENVDDRAGAGAEAGAEDKGGVEESKSQRE